MEVGAVKQAFNNEIILLKKNLNQAKIQTIHKLTRKAKTLTEKKTPEAVKQKLTRKAESAVKEVLIIKKIKAKDIARFIVTHTGKLNEYLNKPAVDNDKACARLLLHKAMQEKYKNIRDKFSNISIKDLFMSRQERLKLKKEAKEKQKNKKKGKNAATVSVEGEWDVEMADTSKENVTLNNSANDETSDFSGAENNVSNGNASDNDSNESDDDHNVHNDRSESNDDLVNESNDDLANEKSDEESVNDDEPSDSKNNDESFKVVEDININKLKASKSVKSSETNNIIPKQINQKNDKPIKKIEKKHKENKNKNLNKKLQKRNFNKDIDEAPVKVSKIVDPFFITSSGDNYMSLVEPRQPDEVKEVHKQGNRKHRRAVMFGHEPRIKPKRHYEPPNDIKQNKFANNKNKIRFDTQNNSKIDKVIEPVAEKLHPSWEAKKKQSGIVPFKGKKIVFDES